MKPFLKKREQLANINFNMGIGWDIRIPSAPKPFNEWFPAIDVEEDMTVISHKSFDFGQTSIKIPTGSGQKTLKIMYLDDHYLTLHEWMLKWIAEDILNDGNGVSPINDIVRQIEIVKTTNAQDEIKRSLYMVIPGDMTLSYNGKNVPSATEGQSHTFLIVSEVHSYTQLSHQGTETRIGRYDRRQRTE